MRDARLVGSAILGFGLLLIGIRADGGERKFGDIVKDIVATLDKMTGTLATIKDEGTAKAAIPDLRQAAGRFKALRKEADKARPPTSAEADRLKKEYRDKLMVSKQKLFAEIARAKMVPGGKQALKEIDLVVKKTRKKPD